MFFSNMDHWFWSVVKTSKPLLMKAISATLILNFFQIFSTYHFNIISKIFISEII